MSSSVPNCTATPTWPKTSNARHPSHGKGLAQSDASNRTTAEVRKSKPSTKTASGCVATGQACNTLVVGAGSRFGIRSQTDDSCQQSKAIPLTRSCKAAASRTVRAISRRTGSVLPASRSRAYRTRPAPRRRTVCALQPTGRRCLDGRRPRLAGLRAVKHPRGRRCPFLRSPTALRSGQLRPSRRRERIWTLRHRLPTPQARRQSKENCTRGASYGEGRDERKRFPSEGAEQQSGAGGTDSA